MKLDQEEKELLELFEKGKLVPVKTKKAELEKAKSAADHYFTKTERINIRLSQFDLLNIRRLAAQEGLPYQTLIGSIIHKYAMGYVQHELSPER